MLAWLKSSRRPSRGQLLAAVAVRNPLVREASRAGGDAGSFVLRLSAPLRPSRLREILGRRPLEKSFDLDELGAFVWNAIDGKRSVESLIRHFAEAHRVTLREADVAVIAFLKTLTERNLVALAVESQEKK
jgi:hypothetical protein